MIRLAKKREFKEVFEIFMQYKKIFPHLRHDYVKRKVAAGECVYQDGVAITFNKYQRTVKLGNCYAAKGDFILHQIASKDPGSGNTLSVFSDFYEHCKSNIWLTVRADNDRAINFYKKAGFKRMGEITWSKGTLLGVVFCCPYRKGKK